MEPEESKKGCIDCAFCVPTPQSLDFLSYERICGQPGNFWQGLCTHNETCERFCEKTGKTIGEYVRENEEIKNSLLLPALFEEIKNSLLLLALFMANPTNQELVNTFLQMDAAILDYNNLPNLRGKNG